MIQSCWNFIYLFLYQPRIYKNNNQVLKSFNMSLIELCHVFMSQKLRTFGALITEPSYFRLI